MASLFSVFTHFLKGALIQSHRQRRIEKMGIG